MIPAFLSHLSYSSRCLDWQLIAGVSSSPACVRWMKVSFEFLYDFSKSDPVLRTEVNIAIESFSLDPYPIEKGFINGEVEVD
jgi:hypothetical protein